MSTNADRKFLDDMRALAMERPLSCDLEMFDAIVSAARGAQTDNDVTENDVNQLIRNMGGGR